MVPLNPPVAAPNRVGGLATGAKPVRVGDVATGSPSTHTVTRVGASATDTWCQPGVVITVSVM